MERADWRNGRSIVSPDSGIPAGRKSGPARLILGSVAAVAAVLSVAWVDYRVLHLNSATAAFTFLLLVLAFATRVGLKESIIASVGSMLAYNFFFLPPVGTFTIADPQNWVALFAFLATAVTVSQLSSSAQRTAEEAGAREEELRRIYNFSRALMLADSDRSFINHVTQQLSQSFELESVSFYDSASDTIREISDNGKSVPESLLRRASACGEVVRDSDKQVLVVPVRLGKDSLGSIGVGGTDQVSEVALQASAQLVAIALERARAQRTANMLEATRQNEQLKSTLLDALAHEFKTPLTSVKAATSTLLARGTEDQVHTELLTVIDEEADRMTKLVSDSIELAKIGSGPVTLHREFFAPDALISSTLAELRPLFEERELKVTTEPSLPPLHVDIKLSSLALRQLLNNALKYSPAGTPVSIDARRLDEHFVVIGVSNEGPGISKAEQSLLFEKFYRGRESRARVPGTGLGLSITREIVETQGGRIWIESEPDQGVTFSFTLPIGAPERVHRAKRQIAS